MYLSSKFFRRSISEDLPGIFHIPAMEFHIVLYLVLAHCSTAPYRIAPSENERIGGSTTKLSFRQRHYKTYSSHGELQFYSIDDFSIHSKFKVECLLKDRPKKQARHESTEDNIGVVEEKRSCMQNLPKSDFGFLKSILRTKVGTTYGWNPMPQWQELVTLFWRFADCDHARVPQIKVSIIQVTEKMYQD
ncbi:hypothetical protein Tco_0367455 [Tanacetum coccineum]